MSQRHQTSLRSLSVCLFLRGNERESLIADAPGWKRVMFPRLDTPSIAECELLANGTVLQRAIFELWRGRSIVSSVRAARLTRDQADALLVALGEMPADHAEQTAKARANDA